MKTGGKLNLGWFLPPGLPRPLDSGTDHVLRDGYRVLSDRAGHFGRAGNSAACLDGAGKKRRDANPAVF